jgi:hypothetical protein
VPPGGSPTNIQYKLNTTDFGGVDSSFVAGANVIWGGSQTVNKAGNRSQEFVIDPTGTQLTILAQQFADPPASGTIFNFERGYGTFLAQGAITTTDSLIGRINFRGMAPTMTQLGYLKTVYTTTLGSGSITTLGSGADGAARIEIGQGATSSYVQLLAGSTIFQVLPGGIVVPGGAPGSMFYQGAPISSISYLTALPATTNGFVLTLVGGFPAWAAVAGASAPSLDQVLNPATANANKVFGMGANQLSFQYTGAEAEDCMSIESASNAAGSGAVLLVRTQGTSSTKVPFLVTANGNASIATLTNGNVGIRSVGDANFALTVDVAPAQFRFGSYGQRSSAVVTDLTFDSLATLTGSATQTAIWYPHRFDLTDSSTAGTGLPNRTALYVRYRRNSTDANIVRSIITADGFSNAGTISGELRGVTAQCDIAGSLTTWTAFYAAGAGGVGVVTNERGFVAEGGTTNGFGTVSPLYTLHVAGSIRFDLGSDQKGDLYFRSDVSAPLTALHPTTNGFVLTLAAGVPTWAAPTGGPGGGAFPGAGANQTLQFKESATSFGTMTGSVISGVGNVDLTLGGNLTFNNTAGSEVAFKRPVNAGNGTQVGKVSFYGQLSGIETLFGHIRGYYSTDFSPADGIIEVAGESGLAALRVASNFATITTGSVFISVQAAGVKCSLGGLGALYYKAQTSDGLLGSLETTGASDGWALTYNATTFLPEWRAVSTSGGIAATGGTTLNAIQTRLTNTTLGGIQVTPANGVLCATAGVNGVCTFVTTFPLGQRYTFTPDNTRAGFNCGINLSLAAINNPSSPQHGDIYYNQFAGKFRFYQNGTWTELGGGGSAGGSAPQLQYNTGSGFGGIGGTGFSTGILDLGDGTTGLRTRMQSVSVLGLSPTLNIDYTLQNSASALDNAYAQRIYFHNQDARNASGGRRVLTLIWDQQSTGTAGILNSDIGLEIFAQSSSGLSLASTYFTGLLIDARSPSVLSNWANFIGIRIKGSVPVTTQKVAIITESGSGSVVFNSGADVAISATSGFLYIPTIAGTTTPSGTPEAFAGTVPICYQWQTNKLWVYNSGWKTIPAFA